MGRRTETVSVEVFAIDWNKTPKTIRNWMADGMPSRMVDGARQIRRAEANDWIVARAVEQMQAPASLAEAEERTAWVRVRRQRDELALERDRRGVITIAEVQLAVGRTFSAMRDAIVSWPARTAHKALGLKSLSTAAACLEDLAYDLRVLLSDENLVNKLKDGPES